MATYRMSGYDRQLFDLRSMTGQLGLEVQKLLNKAISILSQADATAMDDLNWRAEDDKIDQMRDEVVNRALEVIGLRQPRAQDLRWLLGYHRIAQELERIADYACDLAELSELNSERDWPLVIIEMTERLRVMFEQALQFLDPDTEALADLDEMDDFLDNSYNTLQREFIRQNKEQKNGCLGFPLVLARTIERMGDHIVNVAETVIYIKTGQKP